MFGEPEAETLARRQQARLFVQEATVKHTFSLRSPSAAMALVLVFAGLSAVGRAASLPKYDHVIIIFEENKDFGQVIGSANAPYINHTLLGTYGGALFTHCHAEAHPSQPNYIDFFSGANQGVTDNTQSDLPPFTTPNLGASLLAKGYTFKGYAEDLPSVGFTGAFSRNYALKHCPWVNWQQAAGNTAQANSIPASLNVPFCTATDNVNKLPPSYYFPTDYSRLPTIAFVIPNQDNDMHNNTGGGDSGEVRTGDAWLKTYMDGYVQWARTHNSLLILTWDEDANAGQADNQLIPTIFVGANIKAGSYPEAINHYNLLRTLEDMYGLPYCTRNDSGAAPITDVFTAAPAPASLGLLGGGAIGLLGCAWRRWRRIRG
jgi:acid phosphatase